MTREEYSHAPAPPTADQVARRALTLIVVCCRGITEGDRANTEGSEEFAKKAFHWLRAIDLEDELSTWEARILAAPFGALDARDQINASWLSEAVAVLAWALGTADLPPFDQRCDPHAVAESLGFLKPVSETVLKNPWLRSREELSDHNEFVYEVHWRLRDFSLFRRTYDFESLARKAWGEPILKHGLQLAEKDLAIGNVAISRAPEDVRHTVSSITQERHRASNWLIGCGSKDFYNVTTDT